MRFSVWTLFKNCKLFESNTSVFPVHSFLKTSMIPFRFLLAQFVIGFRPVTLTWLHTYKWSWKNIRKKMKFIQRIKPATISTSKNIFIASVEKYGPKEGLSKSTLKGIRIRNMQFWRCCKKSFQKLLETWSKTTQKLETNSYGVYEQWNTLISFPSQSFQFATDVVPLKHLGLLSYGVRTLWSRCFFWCSKERKVNNFRSSFYNNSQI